MTVDSYSRKVNCRWANCDCAKLYFMYRISPVRRTAWARLAARRRLRSSRWALPKPRARAAWATWADDLYNARIAAIHDEVWRAQAAGEDTPMMVLPVGDPAMPFAELAAEPEGLSEAARRRRALAEQVCDALVNPLPRGVWHGEADVIAQRVMPSRVGDDPAMRQPLSDAPGVVERGGPGVLRVDSGSGGVVLRVHGPSWSLVVRISPVVDAIVVFLDSASRYGWRIEDDAESRELIEGAVTRVVAEAARYGWGGDKHASPVTPVG
ncbi:hypothetical protein [Micromonospora sp. HUAS LYJ1]|uniref:hypothetical protein n=1 Tax=Micromonospora sp. HUAS LYJ1 TaxID=3061626 RepID=UPI002670D5EF|nr:hypothetical protein [Micromonospora sp. HUAS LYJ1]WKU07456.1 hypothetical protein Q2K16_10635 [Micromonospora sp. HUAS LYJ1]